MWWGVQVSHSLYQLMSAIPQAAQKAAEWESAAVIVALATVIAAAGYAAVAIIKAIRSTAATEAVDHATDVIKAEVMKANGVPNRFLDISPTPTWFKDASGRMVYLNDAYVARFNVSRAAYYGHDDIEVWGQEIGEQFQLHDEMCRRSGKPVITIERVPDRPGAGPEKTYRWKVIKFPIFDSITGGFKGYGGQAYSIDHPDYETTPVGDMEQRSRDGEV